MHKTYKWKLRGFFWLFNLILQLDNFIKSYLTFSFCRSTFDGSSGLGVKLLDASNATNIFRLYIQGGPKKSVFSKNENWPWWGFFEKKNP